MSEILEQGSWLRTLAHKLVRDAAEADDLVQEVWLSALRSQSPPPTERRAWLATLARRRAADRWRQDGPKPSALGDDRAAPMTETAETLDAHRRLRQAIEKLAPPDQDLVVARYFRGDEPAEIAARTGTPAGSVRSRLSRALDALRVELDRAYGGDGTAWACALVPLALRADGAIASSTASAKGLLVGGTFLGKKLALVAIAAVALILAFFYPWDGSSRRTQLGERAAEAPIGRDATDARRARDTPPPITTPSDAVAADATSEAWSIHVVDADARPVSGARLLLFRESLEDDLRADAAGAIERPAEDGRYRYLLTAPGQRPRLGDVAASGASTLAFPSGAAVAGRVVLEGDVTGREIELTLIGNPGHEFLVEDDIPLDVRLRIDPKSRRAARMTTRPAADGTFRFEGLTADFEGLLHLPKDFGVTGKKLLNSHFFVPTPREDLELRVVALPRIIGRLVYDDGEPVPLQTVTATYALPGFENATTTTNDTTGIDGRFTVGVHSLAGTPVTLRWSGPGGDFAFTLETPFRDSVDVGEIPIARPSVWRFAVVDPDGEPVAGATASLPRDRWSPRTGADGLGEVEAGPLDEVHVAAPGFATTTVSADLTPGTRQRIELLPTTHLVVTVSGLPDGIESPQVRVRGARELIRDGFDVARPSRVHGATLNQSRSGDRVLIDAASSADGRFHFTDLAPGVPLVLDVIDVEHRLLHRSRPIRLDPATRRDVLLTVSPDGLTTVVLEVVDASGAAIPDVIATVTAEEIEDTVYADEPGRVAVAMTRGVAASIRVRAPGFAATELRVAASSAPERVERVVLSR